MANKHRIRLTCKVCGQVSYSREYVGRWPNAWYHNARHCYEAEQICSVKCLDLAQGR